MSALSVALIGCGSIARKHVASIAACPGARLYAVCDVSQERMESMATLWQAESGEKNNIVLFADYRKLLADPAIDIVVVATISSLHAEIAKEALKADKHVVLEKPVALSLKDVDEMIRLAEERGLFVQVCHQLRYRPLMKKIKELVAGGALGNLSMASVTLRIYRPPGYYQTAPWRGTWEYDGGMLLNQGIHAIDLLLWCLGEPSRIYGELYSQAGGKETEDIALGLLSFPSGAKGMIEANSVTLPENLEQSLFLLGDQGVISIGGPKLDRIDRWHIEGQPDTREAALQILHHHDEHIEMYRSLIEACQGKPPGNLIDLRQGRRTLELIFALYLSASTGQVQPLPLAGFSTLQMKQT
ncbi:Gfo/Idh/MocA family protein [Paenibacillus puerhi]|uniref:Gfo/Idh/MocA family protein n=1 Tax=Paenibacillus puerhi TaxID=2692622 RepID=UPI001356EC6C|nr:Gfo/Idh/MocA family oxidoreductase [Paenibacillus puerhi]